MSINDIMTDWIRFKLSWQTLIMVQIMSHYSILLMQQGVINYAFPIPQTLQDVISLAISTDKWSAMSHCSRFTMYLCWISWWCSRCQHSLLWYFEGYGSRVLWEGLCSQFQYCWVVRCSKDAKMAHLDEKTTELVGIQGISSLCNKLLGMCDYHDTKYVLLISGEWYG